MGAPSALIGIIYVITGGIYLTFLHGKREKTIKAPRSLPIWLFLLSFWCLVEAISQGVPTGMAVLGWISYVFFVPLFYIGSELMANERCATKALRIAVIGGGIVSLGGIASALLGQSAPVLLQPIIPVVGIHTSSEGNIFLASSVFATAEEAAELSLIALFAWVALSYLPAGWMKPAFSAIIGMIIVGGLIAAERRADIYVAIAGIVMLLVFNLKTFAESKRRLRTAAHVGRNLAAPLLLAAIGAAVLVSILGADKLLSFLTSTGSVAVKLSTLFGVPNMGLTGQGTGTSTQGVNLVGTPMVSLIANNRGTYPGYYLNGRALRTVEGGFSKTWVELGLVGVLLYGGVFFSTLVPAIRSLSRQDGVARALTVLAVALGVVFLKGHQSLDDPLVQPLFWLVAGGAWGRTHCSAPTAHEDSGSASLLMP